MSVIAWPADPSHTLTSYGLQWLSQSCLKGLKVIKQLVRRWLRPSQTDFIWTICRTHGVHNQSRGTSTSLRIKACSSSHNSPSTIILDWNKGWYGLGFAQNGRRESRPTYTQKRGKQGTKGTKKAYRLSLLLGGRRSVYGQRRGYWLPFASYKHSKLTLLLFISLVFSKKSLYFFALFWPTLSLFFAGLYSGHRSLASATISSI